ncbi:PdxT/SNO family [Emericellopsis atlantica]|uniref:glutaminase n=1 Tax=Emericellopsis atlantica TaxID=2614577 RepID=A0A9P8CNQ6_9HYPO|nr:PdxT/SNO family [Emericellopsis atlantica]KAG9251971.1 PdxT/SNO family [Emericellopsis atlantica]
MTVTITVGVLALQGGFHEHLTLLRRAVSQLATTKFELVEVRTSQQLAQCDALIIPGGESTTMSLVAGQTDLLEKLRDFVKVQKKPTWGTCAGLIMLSNAANSTKVGGQELIGGLSVRVHRNHFGRQIESFEANLDLPFLSETTDRSPFHAVFIRAPVVEEVLAPQAVQVLAKLPGRVDRMKTGVSQATTKGDSGDIVAVREGNVLGMSFHPELTADARIHVWWLSELLKGGAS